ncbi:response regulator transcription factor [Lachnospiraceae bacterium MD1]|uniref:Stage 0 sporulation protein A homolog n=1 Tax=Variimorphobacter saccharofermentans TaxID=2755051 RepID=A0A839K4Z5_9FIRM|nr:response regulator transcription factor [Variimorphobacter saccharofermentans]MBB2183741.1 response regulator transcription factor [Variimorphobacter saccharofermentans]
MNQISVLVVEDNEDINRILKRFLEQAGYQVKSAFSGTEAQLLFSMEHFHLIILDLMLPGLSGEEIIQEIRKKSQTPIIVISAKSSLEDKVNVLKIGADDYITKPFEREEVLVRIEALLRRCHVNNMEASENNEISFKNLLLKVASREVFVKENSITLTAYEFDILYLLLQHPDRVFTKDQLYQEIWKTGYYGEDNTINVHISNIRKKIKDYDEEAYIKTVWGIGFKMDAN